MAEEEKKEDQFGFTPEGESLGYISLEEAAVLARQTARTQSGNYGGRLARVRMVYEVTDQEEGEDFYYITLSFRPEGDYQGRLGREQFFISKNGEVVDRQVLELPDVPGKSRLLLILGGVTVLVVVIAAIIGIVVASRGFSGGDGGGMQAAAPLPTDVPLAAVAPLLEATPSPAATPITAVTSIPVVVPTETAGTIGATQVPVPKPTPTTSAPGLPIAIPSTVPTPTSVSESTSAPTPTSAPSIFRVPTPTPIPTPTPSPTPAPDAAGTLDNEFGTNGIVTVNLHGQPQMNQILEIQTDGKIVVGGIGNQAADGSTGDFTLVRLNQDGSLDGTFGGGGFAVADFGLVDHLNAIILQADGKIIAGGMAVTDVRTSGRDTRDFALARYEPDGDLDRTFGQGGLVTTYWNESQYESIYALALQSDGKILAAGPSGEGTLARYHPDGSLDERFGVQGRVVLDSRSLTHGHTLAVQGDGKIILGGVAGYLHESTQYSSIGIERHNVDGSIDTSFGDDGFVQPIFNEEDRQSSYLWSLAIQPDGKLIGGGHMGHNNFMLVRYKTNGTLDNAFGERGIVVTDMGPGLSNANSVAIQENGKIMVVGTLNRIYKQGKGFGWSSTIGLARYNPDGMPDATFGVDGIVETSITGDASAISMAIQNDGKIVVVGIVDAGSNDPSEYKLVIARFLGESP